MKIHNPNLGRMKTQVVEYVVSGRGMIASNLLHETPPDAKSLATMKTERYLFFLKLAIC